MNTQKAEGLQGMFNFHATGEDTIENGEYNIENVIKNRRMRDGYHYQQAIDYIESQSVFSESIRFGLKKDSKPKNPLIIQSFPMCCTGKVISNIGGTDVTSGRHDSDQRDKIKEHLQEKINQVKKEGNAFCCVVLNTHQLDVEDTLLDLGFDSTDWIGKKNHPETEVKFFFLNLNKKSKSESSEKKNESTAS